MSYLTGYSYRNNHDQYRNHQNSIVLGNNPGYSWLSSVDPCIPSGVYVRFSFRLRGSDIHFEILPLHHCFQPISIKTAITQRFSRWVLSEDNPLLWRLIYEATTFIPCVKFLRTVNRPEWKHTSGCLMHLALLSAKDKPSVCFNPGQCTAPRDLMLNCRLESLHSPEGTQWQPEKAKNILNGSRESWELKGFFVIESQKVSLPPYNPN